MRGLLLALIPLAAGCLDASAPATASGGGGAASPPSAGSTSAVATAGVPAVTAGSGGESGGGRSSAGSRSTLAGAENGGGAGGTAAGAAGEGPLLEWPNADNTGVPADLALSPSDGMIVTSDGQVIEALEVAGAIVVRASDVVIRNCRITHDTTAIRFEEGTNLRVERVTFVGADAATLDGAIQAWGDLHVRRIQVRGFGEGIDLFGAGGLIEDSYFHDMANAEGELMDGIEAWQAAHLTIRHNVIEMPEGNSVIKLPLDVPVPGGDDVLIENNLLAGGGYTVYGGYDPPNQNPSYTNVRFIGNRFSTKFGPKCGYSGPGAFIESELSHDNVWHESGEPLEL